MTDKLPAAIMDAALSTEKGLRLLFPSNAEAMLYRSRCNTKRRAERNRNEKAGLGNQCEWDSLVLIVRGEMLFIVPQDNGFTVEEL